MSNILVELHHSDGGVFIGFTDSVKILKKGTVDFKRYEKAYIDDGREHKKDVSKMTHVLDIDEYTLPVFEGEKATLTYNNHTISVTEDH